MGLFGKKICPTCAGKLGFFSYRIAGGEKICCDCQKMLRGKYDMIQRGAVFYDKLEELDLDTAKRIIETMKKELENDAEKLGAMYPDICAVSETFTVPTEGLEEGGERIVALGGKCVALAFCEFGAFCKGDTVRVLGQTEEYDALILDLVPCKGVYPFCTELISGAHKTEVTQGENAWLVLDLQAGGASVSDRIVKRPEGKKA